MKFMRWGLDVDNDITLCVLGFINITKYRESAIVTLGRKVIVADAPKHLNIKPDEETNHGKQDPG